MRNRVELFKSWLTYPWVKRNIFKISKGKNLLISKLKFQSVSVRLETKPWVKNWTLHWLISANRLFTNWSGYWMIVTVIMASSNNYNNSTCTVLAWLKFSILYIRTFNIQQLVLCQEQSTKKHLLFVSGHSPAILKKEIGE